MATVERSYVINVRREILKAPRYRRAKKAVSAVKAFIKRHMKAELGKIKLGKYLNLELWKHGIKAPLTKIKVVAVKDDKGMVKVELPNPPKEKARFKAKATEAETKEAAKEKEKQAEAAEKTEKTEKTASALEAQQTTATTTAATK